jgi:hypothetical protein
MPATKRHEVEVLSLVNSMKAARHGSSTNGSDAQDYYK